MMRHLDRWSFSLHCLRGRALPPLPAIAGRVIRAADAPLAAADLAAITCPIELATVLGIARATAVKRLAERAAHTPTYQKVSHE